MHTGNWSATEIKQAALRPMGPVGWRFWLLLTPLGLLVLWGLVAWGIQLTRGLQVTGLNDRVFWGTYETNLVTFIGYSYGGALVSAILRLTGAEWRAPITRIAEAMALVTLSVGSIFAFIHLGRPERVWEMLVRPQFSSPVVWDAIAILTYLVATAVFLYLPLIPDLAVAAKEYAALGKPRWRARFYRLLSVGWRDLPQQQRLLEWGTGVISVVIIPLAITVHSVLSWAFSLHAREGWHSTIFGPYFVVGALYSGVACVILVVSAYRKAYGLQQYLEARHLRYLGYIMLSLGLLYLYFMFSELLTEGYGQSKGGVHLIEMMLEGHFAGPFWLVVGAGVALPALLVALPKTSNVAGVTAAAALVVVAMWQKRFLIVVPALHIPPVGGAEGTYQPSWVEMSITAGTAAAIPFLLMLFFRLFPVMAIWEMHHIGQPARHSRLKAVPAPTLPAQIERGS